MVVANQVELYINTSTEDNSVNYENIGTITDIALNLNNDLIENKEIRDNNWNSMYLQNRKQSIIIKLTAINLDQNIDLYVRSLGFQNKSSKIKLMLNNSEYIEGNYKISTLNITYKVDNIFKYDITLTSDGEIVYLNE